MVDILVCALTAAFFSGYLSCVRSAGHISWQISFECCIQVHYILIYTHMILLMLLLVLTIVRGTGNYLYVILLFRRGGGVLCPSFEQKDDAKIAASAGGYIRIARQWRFLVIIIFHLIPSQPEQWWCFINLLMTMKMHMYLV